LSEHIQQTVQDRDTLSFNCPIDRIEVPRPRGNLHPREWVKHFPSDTFTNNLIQAVKIHEGTADGAGEMVIQSDQQPQSVSVQQREVSPLDS
jgi:hypothetical protein